MKEGECREAKAKDGRSVKEDKGKERSEVKKRTVTRRRSGQARFIYIRARRLHPPKIFSCVLFAVKLVCAFVFSLFCLLFCCFVVITPPPFTSGSLGTV